jgi:hypothetical protein
MFIKNETIQLGQDMINNCQKWKQGMYCYYNGNIDIWTANGVLEIDSYPKIDMFNIFEKFYIHRCIKKSKIKRSISK